VSRIIHHGIETDVVPVGDGAGGYLAFLGRVAPAKGIVEAITVAQAAGIPLRIAAKCREPEEREYFDHAVRPQLGRGVEYLGELGERDKFALLGSAAALLNPIQWDEPFGLVMIEALATGTPVLTLDRGAAPEIVVDGATGFITHDTVELFERVARVDELDRAACRRSAETRFSATRMVDDHLDLYRELLARGTPSLMRHRAMAATG
jgi:glycosyltransferase involved in cell wall biosynthesis